MPDNTPSQLQAILKKMHTSVTIKMGNQVISTQKAMSNDQAEQAILALFMQCLPRPYSKAELEDMPQNKVEESLMINQAIDITAQHMRALTKQLEQEQTK